MDVANSKHLPIHGDQADVIGNDVRQDGRASSAHHAGYILDGRNHAVVVSVTAAEAGNIKPGKP